MLKFEQCGTLNVGLVTSSGRTPIAQPEPVTPAKKSSKIMNALAYIVTVALIAGLLLIYAAGCVELGQLVASRL